MREIENIVNAVEQRPAARVKIRLPLAAARAARCGNIFRHYLQAAIYGRYRRSADGRRWCRCLTQSRRSLRKKAIPVAERAVPDPTWLKAYETGYRKWQKLYPALATLR